MSTPTRIAWQTATIERIVQETPRVKSFSLRMPEWQPFRAGQHFDVRLTAPDGYQAQRSYSAASAPERAGVVDLTIERIEGGEVSPYFHDVATPGDRVELRGPIGGPFTWSAAMGGPLLLLGGGSGVVPLMSMLRHRRSSAPAVPAVLVYSARSIEDVIYRDELARMAGSEPGFQLIVTLTRSRPEGWNGPARRVDAAMVGEALVRAGPPGHVYCCGSDGFVENAANLIVAAGVPAERVRTERFGPTGGAGGN
jgi:ferredoxin-NADP reductase